MWLKRFIWSVAIALLMLSIFSSVDWAPVAASRLGQTVPTFTPTPESATPAPTAESATATPQVTPLATAQETPALLPVAGAEQGGGLMFVAIAGLTLLALAWGVRQRTPGDAR
ncbi:MAG TPA: hypothetical protein VJG32_11925 [Anaerolineae bacterium]|nr:hypothetical protein [Anaerolineae bacterium]